MIEDASDKPKTGIISTFLGAVILFIGAGGVVGQLQTSLNKVWGVEPKSGQGIWGFIRQRFISYAMVFAVGFSSPDFSCCYRPVNRFCAIFRELNRRGCLCRPSTRHGRPVRFCYTAFREIYKFVPDIQIQWKDVWVGAALTSILFTIGKFLIGLYLGNSGVTSAYGAAGSLITILLWVFYSSLIFLLGAEFTQSYASAYG